jgi:hypothetical protein
VHDVPDFLFPNSHPAQLLSLTLESLIRGLLRRSGFGLAFRARVPSCSLELVGAFAGQDAVALITEYRTAV